jgi:hypothetical protein
MYCTYRHEYNEEYILQAKHPATLEFRLQSIADTRLQQYFSSPCRSLGLRFGSKS